MLSVVVTLCLTFPGVCEKHMEQYPGHEVPETTGPVERWRPLVEAYFPAHQVDRALCIIRHESRGNPRADNPRSSARGLFQILGSLWAPHYGVSRAELYDPHLNVILARDIWANYGWWAWSPYQRGLCR